MHDSVLGLSSDSPVLKPFIPPSTPLPLYSVPRPRSSSSAPLVNSPVSHLCEGGDTSTKAAPMVIGVVFLRHIPLVIPSSPRQCFRRPWADVGVKGKTESQRGNEVAQHHPEEIACRIARHFLALKKKKKKTQLPRLLCSGVPCISKSSFKTLVVVVRPFLYTLNL